MDNIIEKIRTCNISYHCFGKSDRSAMPLGNGELCASVWINELGEICFYLSRSDALTEFDRNVKLGLIRVSCNPNPFLGSSFVQELNVAEGYITFHSDKGVIELFIDPRKNQVILKGRFGENVDVSVSYFTWRDRPIQPFSEFEYHGDIYETADVVDLVDEGILFYHQNGNNIIRESAQVQNMEDVIGLLPDFLTNRIFGGYLYIEGGKEHEGKIIKETTKQVCIKVITESCQNSTEIFRDKLLNQRGLTDETDIKETCRRYWGEYWEQSYIFIENDKNAAPDIKECILDEAQEPDEYTAECKSQVTLAYVLTRFMLKCCGNGGFPILYNGMLFNLCPGKNQHFNTTNFGKLYTAAPGEITYENNPDERSWCVEHLWQNVRHPYYTFLAQGEVESLKVLFKYYHNFEKLNKHRASLYYGAKGQHNTEMTMSFGLQSIGIYGVDRKDKPVGYAVNRYGGAVDISPGLELLGLMLDYYEYTQDEHFFQSEIIVYAKDIFMYVETRFPKRKNNKIIMEPLNSIETYWDTRNPITVAAGLISVAKRLLEHKDLCKKELNYFEEFYMKIPDIPMQEEQGEWYLQPAEILDEVRHNIEIPELYACFPFGIYDIFEDSEKIELMKRTFEKRIEEYKCNRPFCIGDNVSYPSYSGWQYQGIVAARLGMKELAQEILVNNVQMKNPGNRFPAMWGPIYDGVPDTDHGANIIHLLQQMVMQVKGNNVYILPAFPKEWNVSFKLHPNSTTTIELEYKDGKIKKMDIYPEEEKNNIIITKSV